jgi:hypothetical protein
LVAELKRLDDRSLPESTRGYVSDEREGTVFIVQAKPRGPEGILKVTKNTREEALEAAKNFLNQGLPFVTIVADGRVYTTEEFGMSIKREE